MRAFRDADFSSSFRVAWLERALALDWRAKLRSTPLWVPFERDLIANEPPDYFRSHAIFEGSWAEAVALGALPSKDPLEGIEDTIALARALHVRTTPGADR